MGLFGGNSGTVAETPQEQSLTANMWSQWQDYQQRWLPVQQHLADVVNDMANPQAWQRQEAEGKAGVDVASAFQQRDQQQAASAMTRGINPGSAAFKLGVVSSNATSQAQTKGAQVAQANEQIDKSYIENLKAITNSGQQLANTSTQGQGIASEVATREAISNAQTANLGSSEMIASAGLGLSALASPQGQSAISSLFSSGGGIAGPGATLGETSFAGGGYTPGLNVNTPGSNLYQPALNPGGIQ